MVDNSFYDDIMQYNKCVCTVMNGEIYPYCCIVTL